MDLATTLKQVSQDLALAGLGFWPELALVGTILILLLLRLLSSTERLHSSGVAMVGTLLALGMAVEQWWQAPSQQQIFGVLNPNAPAGLLFYDGFTIFFRLFLLGFLALVIWMTMLSGVPGQEESADFYTLLLGATLGMSIMASASHLLMLYIGVEMASVPSYAMAGFLKQRRESSEASLKYVVYGAGASGIMLYGISLLMGIYGTGHIPTLVRALGASLAGEGQAGPTLAVVLALLMILVGISFKLAAVPFHFWCPDVFEGAATEVAAFLSVASKGAALGMLTRFVVAFAANPQVLAEATSVRDALGVALAVLAAVTATFGNLAAYAQTNLKRLLAYSTIAHAGYMIMPVAAALKLATGKTPHLPQAEAAIQALVFYLVVYLFMNLGAFAVVAFIRNEIGSEDLADYAGLIYRSPALTVCMAVFLLSLTGVPPLAGFVAKFRIFAALLDARMWWLLAVGTLNTVLSLFYYVKVLRVMILDPAPADARPVRVTLWSPAGMYTLLLAVPLVALTLSWNSVHVWAGEFAAAVFGGR